MPLDNPISDCHSIYSSTGGSEYGSDHDSIQKGISLPSSSTLSVSSAFTTTNTSQHRKFSWASRDSKNTSPQPESPFDRYPTIRRKSILKLDDMLEQLSEHISTLAAASGDELDKLSDTLDSVILEELIIDHYLSDDCQEDDDDEARPDSAVSSIHPPSIHKASFESISITRPPTLTRAISRIRRIEKKSVSGNSKEYIEVALSISGEPPSFVCCTQFELPLPRLGQDENRQELSKSTAELDGKLREKKRRSFLMRVRGIFGRKKATECPDKIAMVTYS